MTVSIGVPTLNRYDLCAGLIESAYAVWPPDRFLVVDNGAALPDAGFDTPHPVEIIRPGVNIGVASAWNLFARECLVNDEDRLLISGDDVVLYADTLKRLVDTMNDLDVDFIYPDPSQSTRAGQFSCFMVRKRLFDKVGHFDEAFWPAYFEDNDFHYRMKMVGATEAVASCGYYHAMSATMAAFDAEQLEAHHTRFRASRDYYISKWGGGPHEETFQTPFNA